jgi:hypothetical protein
MKLQSPLAQAITSTDIEKEKALRAHHAAALFVLHMFSRRQYLTPEEREARDFLTGAVERAAKIYEGDGG